MHNNSNQTTSITTPTPCSRCATDNCSTHPVQQGEVSSTEPPLPEPSLLNGQEPEISAYFEALEHYISSVGWVLLQVNSDGIVESCTQNIRELIGYEKHELYHKPLHMYLYPGDQAKLDPVISNMAATYVGGGGGNGNGSGDIGVGLSGWVDGNEDHNSQQSLGKQKRSISTKVRMLVKDMRSATQTSGSSNPHDSVDQKPTRHLSQQEKYEEVVLIAAPVKGRYN